MYRIIGKLTNFKQGRRPHIFTIVHLVIITIIVILSGYLILTYKIPFRLPDSDVFQQMAAIKNFGNPAQLSHHDAYFGSGPTDLHSGPYYFTIYILSIFTNQSLYTTILILAILNILFICISLYYFARSFDLDQRQVLFFILIALFGWGVLPFWAGLFDYTNLLVTGSFSATIGICFILICLGLGRRLLSGSRGSAIPLIILLSSVVLSHLLSGIILIALLFLLLLTEVIAKKSVSSSARLLLFSLMISICSTLFIWPLFGLLNLFSSTRTIKLGGGTSQNIFALPLWPQLFGVGFLGFAFLPYLIKMKQYFIALLIVFTSVITISYLFPIRISLYWRFFPYVFLAISFALASYLGRQRKDFPIIVLLVIVIIGVVRVDHRLQELTIRPVISNKEFSDLMNKVPGNSVVFSDPNTSYRIAALYPVRVVVVPYTHANPSNFDITKQRYDDTIKILKSKPSEIKQRKFFIKYKVQYVLINKYPYHDGLAFNNSDWVSTFKIVVPGEVIDNQAGYYIYKIKELNV